MLKMMIFHCYSKVHGVLTFLFLHKDPVLSPSGSVGHQPFFQRGQGEGERWSSGWRGRAEEAWGRGGGWRVRLTPKSCRPGRSLPLFPDAVAGGVSVSAPHLPNLWLPLLLYQHLPAQHVAGERWDVKGHTRTAHATCWHESIVVVKGFQIH